MNQRDDFLPFLLILLLTHESDQFLECCLSCREKGINDHIRERVNSQCNSIEAQEGLQKFISQGLSQVHNTAVEALLFLLN